jgi:hypothetical protein
MSQNPIFRLRIWSSTPRILRSQTTLTLQALYPRAKALHRNRDRSTLPLPKPQKVKHTSRNLKLLQQSSMQTLLNLTLIFQMRRILIINRSLRPTPLIRLITADYRDMIELLNHIHGRMFRCRQLRELPYQEKLLPRMLL